VARDWAGLLARHPLQARTIVKKFVSVRSGTDPACQERARDSHARMYRAPRDRHLTAIVTGAGRSIGSRSHVAAADLPTWKKR